MPLNYDILSELLRHIKDRRTLSRMMRTCHTLYCPGIPLLVGVDVVRIDLDNLAAVRYFLSRDISRCAHLRRVHLSAFTVQPPHLLARMDTFSTIFAAARNLTELTIESEVLQYCPRLITAISSMESINFLSLSGLNYQARQLLQDMRSPVRILHLPLLGQTGYVDFVPLASLFCNTLEQLEIKFPVWPTVSDQAVVFPRLTSLSLEFFDPSSDVAALMRMMPNLRCLHADLEANAVGLDAFRQANLAAQKNMGPARWRSLDYAKTSLNSLYGLAPRCHIRHLALSSVQLRSEDVRRYRDVLVKAQPIHLSLDLRRMLKAKCDFESLFRQTPPSVTRLDLSVQLPASSPVRGHIVRLGCIQVSCDITYLSVGFRTYCYVRLGPCQL